MGRPTIQDIARRVGVLAAAVSHVINDYPGHVRAAPRRLFQLSSPPTAILAANDTMAMGALRGIHAAGLWCPDDVAVVGIGDPPFMAFAAPPLMTVALPVEEAGRRAAKRLLDQIRGGETSSWTELLPCTLIVRESSGAAAEDSRTARRCHKVDNV